MKNTELIFQAVTDLEKAKFIQFKPTDIRNDYLNRQKGLLLSYCKGYMHLELINRLKIEDFEFDKYEQILWQHTVKDENSTIRYISHFHRNLIISTWSLFEMLINEICYAVLDKITIDSLLNFKYREIEKFINVNEKEKVKDKLKYNHLSHVPISRKYGKLLKLCGNQYGRDKDIDQKFLDLFGTLRNTMHSNFIYFGNNKDFLFKNVEFKFTNKCLVVYSDTDSISPALYINLVKEINSISIEISKAVNFEGLIPYPDINAQ